jgi:6-pyruvoyltetrahydropterin/6-carboxytetrahydropterin synthase
MNMELDAHPELSGLLQGFDRTPGRFMVRIEGRFESSHYLYRYFPDGRDEPLHGHSWLVEVFLAHRSGGTRADGISFDFLAARQRLDQLIERIEHICINELREFAGVNPTSENIARWFYLGLRDVVAADEGQVLEVRIHEGPANIAIFRPDADVG